MKLKFFGILLVSLLAVAIFSGGMPGVSVAADVYLPIPGDNSVSQWVYTSTTATKGWTKLSAISKSVEINFGKDNYLLFNNNISGEGINVILRDKTIFPTNDSSSINGSFAQSVDPSPPHAYINHTNDWIVKPLSPVYTIVPSQTLTASNGPLPGYSFVSPSTISLKYNSNISDSYETVSVLYRIDDNSPWEILPGLVNSGSKTVTATFTTNGFGSYCVVNLDSDFNEFQSGDIAWSQQYVKSLWNKGIMSQVQTGTAGDFGLLYNTTRGEFAAMLVKGMRLPLESISGNVFSDVSLGDSSLVSEDDNVDFQYYYPQWREYACTAAKYGLFNGIRAADGTLQFQPRKSVSREQAAALITRALNLKVDYMDDPSNDKVYTALRKLYEDVDDIEIWARPYVLAVSKAKYMSGEPINGSKKTNFGPLDPITRPETAKIIQKVLKNKKLI